MEPRLSTGLEDPLYAIFEEHLHSGLYDEQPVENFVRDVVEYYFKSLTDNGHVPHKMRDSLRMDLGQDVVDMLKTKIYGHYGIGEYNNIRRKKSS
jgi:hypothetical protein